jgi:hypothetical protein
MKQALDERRLLTNEVNRLRNERVDLQDEIASLRRGEIGPVLQPIDVETPAAVDLQTAVAEEMRTMLAQILADFRSRVAAPPAVAAAPPVVAPPQVAEIVAKAETIAAPPVAAAPIVAELGTVSMPADVVRSEAAPIETFESIVEHVDEFVRPALRQPIVEEDVEELRRPEPIAPADVFAVEAAPVDGAASIVEEPFIAEAPPWIEPVAFEAALPEAAPLPVDTHVFEPIQPPAPIVDDYDELRRQAIELTVAPAEPIEPVVDEYVEEFRRPEAPPPIEPIELTAAPPEPIEPFVADYIEDVVRHEPIEPRIDQHVVPASDVTIRPFVSPPTPDAHIDALWDAATPTNAAETAPPPSFAPPSFISDQLIAETRTPQIPEAPLAPPPMPPQEFPREQMTVESAAPLIEYAPEPPAIVEPEPDTRYLPLIGASEPVFSHAPVFPELSVADERGLHQIQVVIAPIHSFPRLLETERRIRGLSTVSALHLRDFRNGVATLTVSVSEAISPAEFGAVIQMLESLHLRLEGTTPSSVELLAEEEPPTS